jgi:hypothetical protein
MFANTAWAAPKANLETGSAPLVGPATIDGGDIVIAFVAGVINLQRNPFYAGFFEMIREMIDGHCFCGRYKHTGFIENDVS